MAICLTATGRDPFDLDLVTLFALLHSHFVASPTLALMKEEDREELLEMLSWPEDVEDNDLVQQDRLARQAAGLAGFDLEAQLAAVMAERERLGVGSTAPPAEWERDQ